MCFAKGLFCTPDNLVITNDESIGMLERDLFDEAGAYKVLR